MKNQIWSEMTCWTTPTFYQALEIVLKIPKVLESAKKIRLMSLFFQNSDLLQVGMKPEPKLIPLLHKYNLIDKKTFDFLFSNQNKSIEYFETCKNLSEFFFSLKI